MVRWIILAVLVPIGALTIVPAQAPAQAAPAPTILVFGDSISAAYGMRAEEGWVALLQKKLATEEYGWRVVNASVSGETTDGGLARLPRALKLHQPKVVVLELGANDGLRGLPPEGIKKNLETMVATARGAGAQVLLIGMPLPTNYGALYTRRFARVFEDMARQQNLAFVPFMMKDAQGLAMVQEDGLHPSAAAQPKLLAMVWPELKRLMRQATQERP